MNLHFRPEVHELLQGAVDIHIHSAPDIFPRIQNDVELALQAQEMGMRAIVIKSHWGETACRAALASQLTGFSVFGGIALNRSVGGLNPHAVAPALKMGAKLVWMPTMHAQAFVAQKGQVQGLAREIPGGLEGLGVLNPDGSLRPECYAIFDLIIAHDSCLATGHLSKDEARVLVSEAAKRGVKKIVITHPMACFMGYNPQEMKRMLDLGATWLEHVYNDTTRVVSQPLTCQALMEGIKAVGAEHSIMSTDAGQCINPIPAQQMGIYIGEALGAGLSAGQIRRMAQDNPAALLGL
ncbi:MAG: DUF6282 family protein [Thermodesulfobacteriota bacterium]